METQNKKFSSQNQISSCEVHIVLLILDGQDTNSNLYLIVLNR